jgi:hypothetical protein
MPSPYWGPRILFRWFSCAIRSHEQAGWTKRAQNQKGQFNAQGIVNEMLDLLKNSLRDLKRVRMTAPDDPELLALKQQIQKMIERSEGTAN